MWALNFSHLSDLNPSCVKSSTFLLVRAYYKLSRRTMQHQNLIHKANIRCALRNNRSKIIFIMSLGSKIIYDHASKTKYLSSSMSLRIFLTYIPDLLMTLFDRRERAYLIWVSHPYPFLFAHLIRANQFFENIASNVIY